MIADYIGIKYSAENFNCADLVTLYFEKEFGIEVIINKANNYFSSPTPIVNSVCLMTTPTRQWHVGVVLPSSKLLHNFEPFGSVVITSLNQLNNLGLAPVKYYQVLK